MINIQGPGKWVQSGWIKGIIHICTILPPSTLPVSPNGFQLTSFSRSRSFPAFLFVFFFSFSRRLLMSVVCHTFFIAFFRFSHSPHTFPSIPPHNNMTKALVTRCLAQVMSVAEWSQCVFSIHKTNNWISVRMVGAEWENKTVRMGWRSDLGRIPISTCLAIQR